MIYLDHHATTPVLPEVWEAMRPYMSEVFGNPSSAHAFGRKARQALEDARERIAPLLGAFPDEVIFTSGATEANNLAIFGLAGDPPGHILASPIEHPCVIEPLKQLAARGFEIEWLPVQHNGSVAIEALTERVRPQTRLIALMLVNHETGAVQPVGLEPLVASRTSAKPQAAFHTDAAQAVGKIPVDFHALGVTTLSLSGHKFGAPKGIGALLLKRGTKLRPQLYGGHQQQGRRPGTEPVALAVGLATALACASAVAPSDSKNPEPDAQRGRGALLGCVAPSDSKNPEPDAQRGRGTLLALATRRARVDGHPGDCAGSEQVFALRLRLLDQLRTAVPPIVVNSPDNGSPYVLNVSFPGCRADLLLMKLDLLGVACSTGSACSSGSLLPSPVLQAMGVADEVLRSAMRFSFSSSTSDQEIDEAAQHIIKSVKDLRTVQT